MSDLKAALDNFERRTFAGRSDYYYLPPLLAAARAYEAGEDIEWCDEHRAMRPLQPAGEDDGFPNCYEWWIGEHVPEAGPLTPCRMVSRRLTKPVEDT